MKKTLSILLAVMMLASSLTAFTFNASAGVTDTDESLYSISYSPVFRQTEARKVLNLINTFRSSSTDAWYWNKDNANKIYPKNLNDLTYDYNLEKVAMQRAAEIAICFDKNHLRPNGNICYEVYDEFGYTCTSKAENIAAGNYVSTAADVHELFREDNEKYNKQGHRRTMLNSAYRAVGIACVYYEGAYFWVEEFSNKVSAGNTFTTAVDSARSCKVDISSAYIKSVNLSCDSSTIGTSVGTETLLPEVTAQLYINSDWTKEIESKGGTVYPYDVTLNVSFTSSDPSVAQINGNKLVGVSEGKTTAVAYVAGNKITLNVKIMDASHEHDLNWEIYNGLITKRCKICRACFEQLRFTDINDYLYYADYIVYTSVDNSFINGTNPPDFTLFSPKTAITRAMFVTILYRMAGSPYDSVNPHKTTPFTDITNTSVYYYNAACWALDNEITTETTFKPNNMVVREQTAAFLFRYADKEGFVDDSYKEVNLKSYPDYSSVSVWARGAMQWANQQGMITGTKEGYLNPKGSTQRIHATKILFGFGNACGIA